LRDYKTEPLIWDGAPDCEHEWTSAECPKDLSFRPGESTTVGTQLNPGAWGDGKSSFCQKCGAWRGQLGLEPDPNLYIKHLCDIFDEVKRVLKKSGTCWVNIGDSYGGSRGEPGSVGNKKPDEWYTRPETIGTTDKCLVQIPSRFGLEMVNRGWILRNEIIWHKPNCMPSSVTDRFTVDFEKVFFFVKSKKYYFKQQLEPVKEVSLERAEYGWECSRANNGVNGPQGIKTEKMGSRFVNPSGRNKRTVWTISTKPYSGSHFAVFPIDLIAPMIDAGCPKDGTVLDIFCGSGTVLEYARKNGLNGIGIELNPDYKELAVDRALLNIPPITNYGEAIDKSQN